MSPYLKDLAERVGATFVAGAGAALLANWTGAIPSDWEGWLLTGAFAGVASVVKGIVAKCVGDKGTASMAPSLVTTEATDDPGRHELRP